MNEVIEEAKAEYLRAKERLIQALNTTPDDRINWSPSPTSRTPIQQVAHAAMGVDGIQGFITGKPFGFANTAEADAMFRAAEREYTRRDHVLALLDKTSTDYLAWLDTVTPEQLASTVDTAFGPIPMRVGITLPADHMRAHIAQIHYTQSIYGDHDWYM